MALSNEQRRRIHEALGEANRLLEKEMRYAADLRKPEQIAFYERHIAKLNSYLDSNQMPHVFERS